MRLFGCGGDGEDSIDCDYENVFQGCFLSLS